MKVKPVSSCLDGRLKSNLTGRHVRDIHSIKYTMTLASIRYNLTIPTKTTLSTITSSPTKDKCTYSTLISDFLETEMKRNGDESRAEFYHSLVDEVQKLPEIGEIRYQQPSNMTTYQVPKHQVSLKSSPNGVSLFSFLWDRLAVRNNPSLEEHIREFARTYYLGSTDDWIDEKLEQCDDIPDESREVHVGKTSLTHEAGKLKPRVFAIVESLTQTLLSEFHNNLMNVLRLIPEDCTFDHDKVALTAKKLYLQRGNFYGFADLSAATDSLPVEPYRDLANYWINGLGTAWINLFDREFLVSDSVRRH